MEIIKLLYQANKTVILDKRFYSMLFYLIFKIFEE